ncbi:hypothetical protein ZWY2020_027976 [Hordeum vulgare]|nr:hypothetical protein ZWY2020_027976 [Hordeum vulgare]
MPPPPRARALHPHYPLLCLRLPGPARRRRLPRAAQAMKRQSLLREETILQYKLGNFEMLAFIHVSSQGPGRRSQEKHRVLDHWS